MTMTPQTTCFYPPEGYQFWNSIRFVSMGKSDPTVSREPHRIRIARWYKSGPASLELSEKSGTIKVVTHGEGAAEALLASEQILGLHDTPVTDFGHARLNRRLRPVMGTHLSRMPFVSQALPAHVLQQQIAWVEAVRIWKNLIDGHAEMAPGPWGLRLPLSAEQLRRLPTHAYQVAGVSQQRIAALREIGRLGYRIDDWLSESVDVFRHKIQLLPHIGPWTANHVLAVSMGEPDVLVPGDYSLPHTVCWALKGEPRGTDARMAELLEPFRGNRWRIVRLFWALNVVAPKRGPKIATPHTRRR